MNIFFRTPVIVCIAVLPALLCASGSHAGELPGAIPGNEEEIYGTDAETGLMSGEDPGGIGAENGRTAVRTGKPGVRLAWDALFRLNFDNMEYDPSPIASSGTIFGARLTPAIGIDGFARNGSKHRLMLGIDIMKDFGRSPIPEYMAGGATSETDATQNNLRLFGELVFYYRFSAIFGKTDLSLTAGIFPKSLSGAEDYPRSFFSDRSRFYDNNYEGLLISFTRPRAYYEAGCDWIGMYGTDRRERFMIFSRGRAEVLPWMSLGYYAYMYHFAGCDNVWGVVDNILLNPYAEFSAAWKLPLQMFRMRLGLLASGQNDRRMSGKYTFPMGGEWTFEIRKWNAGLRHDMFVGKNMMPYYTNADGGGFLYADRLYFGDPFYRMGSDFGVYNRIEVYWEPHLADFVDLRIGLSGHFHEKYSGFQQQVGLVFGVERMRKSLSGKKRK